MGSKSTSAIHFCRDFQRCEVPLPHLFSALIAKDLKFRLDSRNVIKFKI